MIGRWHHKPLCLASGQIKSIKLNSLFVCLLIGCHLQEKLPIGCLTFPLSSSSLSVSLALAPVWLYVCIWVDISCLIWLVCIDAWLVIKVWSKCSTWSISIVLCVLDSAGSLFLSAVFFLGGKDRCRTFHHFPCSCILANSWMNWKVF